ncbi:YhdX [Bacillus subtilis QB928]|nr:YhdX [Bacillus subtilis QB928]
MLKCKKQLSLIRHKRKKVSDCPY